jgi:hypothetical protein
MVEEAQRLDSSTSKESQTSPSSSAVSLDGLDKSSGNGRLNDVLGRTRDLLSGRGVVVAGVIGVLLIVFLFLPPISLGSRLTSGGGYTTLDASTPSVEHPDGLTLSVSDEPEKRLRVKLDAVPRADFLVDEAGEEAQAAREALPSYLIPKSPFYLLDVRGESEAPVNLVVEVPNEAEPWETLDLYGWDGETWRWLPNRLDRDAVKLVAEVDALPESVMVMQSGAVELGIVTESADLPPTDYEGVLTNVDLVGMKIGTLGAMTGDPSLLPPGSVSSELMLAPTVRNWVPDRDPNSALVSDMLTIPEDREAHLENLTSMVVEGNYAGLVLDYRALSVEDRDAYASFVEELAGRLHEQGAWLGVTVESPVQTADGGWNTGGYDWVALGKAADQVRVIMPLDPTTYAPGGLVEGMIEWGTTQVSRYKLYPIFSTLCTDGTDTLTMDEVLAGIGKVQAKGTVGESVEPGSTLEFELAGDVNVETDSLLGATMMQVGERSYWLGTPEWLRSRMDLASRFRLGGVVLCDMLEEGNFPDMVSAIEDYQAQVASIAYTAPDVVWVATAPDGSVSDAHLTLRQADYSWVAPELTGTYQIEATVAGIPRGSFTVEVAEPMAEEVDVAAAEADEEDAEEAAEAEEDAEEAEEEEEVGLEAAFVTDVTVPDNTHFDNDEQFTKTWRMRNTGGEAWPEGTTLTFLNGTQMTDQGSVEVGAVEPGDEVDVSVDMRAPMENGTFKGTWVLSTEGNHIPGGRIFVIIQAGEVAETDEGEEGQAGTPPPAPAPVAGGAFELGGHIRDGSYPHADRMHYAGMSWSKKQVRWQHNPAGDVQAAHANGFKIQLSALGPASMVTEGGFKERYAAWVADMAAAGADAIEIWNEPNLPREWQEGHISPESYTELLCASYAAIKAANPNTAVISAAPAPTGYFGGCHAHGCDDVPWLQRMYNAGAANCMDYIGAHHNAGATPPAATSGHPADGGGGHHSWYFLPQTQIYYNIFGGSRQLFYTELGYVSPDGYGWIPETFAWGANTSVAQQAQWLADVVSLSSQTGMVRVVIVWNVDFNCYGDCGGVQDPQGGYSILRPDGSCPACDSLHALLGTR